MASSRIDLALHGSIYSIDSVGASALLEAIKSVEERIQALRNNGRLTEDTLRRYYGAKRFEQVAESNAIEGSTLSVGETELAVVKGVTLTGHDPAYVRDAVALDRALTRLAEMAKWNEPTNINQVKELHELILGERTGSGEFRSSPVRITGSRHQPPKDWEGVMTAMEHWEKWSSNNSQLAAPLRAAVLHAWLAWVHPFVDGNGRASRAISNLELMRAGYPPAIIRKTQDRDRYISALQASDEAGDIGPFMDLMLERIGSALTGLEGAAKEMEGYNQTVALLRNAQARKLAVWNRSVELLYEVLVDKLAENLDQIGGAVHSEVFSSSLALEDYIALCNGRFVSQSWAFKIQTSGPGLHLVERLAWVGPRSQSLRSRVGDPAFTPSVFWSKRNTSSYPPWTNAVQDAPGLCELSISPGQGDDWHILACDNAYKKITTSKAAEIIANGFAELMSL